MSEIQFIVQKLKQEPFNMRLSLVAFDEKSNFEILELLHDVFKEIDPFRHGSVDFKRESDDDRTERFMRTLEILKFRFPYEDLERYRASLRKGERAVVYPILYWALSNFKSHSKRAYLSRFLLKLDIPQDYLQDEALSVAAQQLSSLQNEFISAHRQVDELRKNQLAPQELRGEITQLEQEKNQLEDKIERMKDKTANEPGFQELLQVTSTLRKEQEEESKLHERKRDQNNALAAAERRYNDMARKLAETRANSNDSVSPEVLLERLEEEVRAQKQQLQTSLPKEHKIKLARLQEIEAILNEPTKTVEDIEDLENSVRQFQRNIHNLNEEIKASQRQSGGDEMLPVYRQHASTIAKQLQTKERELEDAKKDRSELLKQFEEKELKASEISSQNGNKQRSEPELKKYAKQIRAKTREYTQKRQQLAEIKNESVVLSRTEQILRGRDKNLKDYIDKMEAKKGVAGFNETKNKMEEVSEKMSQVNEMKGKTLAEISLVVTNINQTLKERKNRLAPQIKELRTVRQRFQEFEQEYFEKKALYENTAVHLETERLKLEQECAAFQQDCIEQERTYHLTNCLLSIKDVQLQKVEDEERCQAGNGTLSAHGSVFKSWEALYKHKIQTEENLSKQLRKQQKDLKQDEGDFMEQKVLFNDLEKLLRLKLKLTAQQSSGSMRMGGGGDTYGMGSSGSTYDQTVGGGSVNVMTFDN